MVRVTSGKGTQHFLVTLRELLLCITGIAIHRPSVLAWDAPDAWHRHRPDHGTGTLKSWRSLKDSIKVGCDNRCLKGRVSLEPLTNCNRPQTKNFSNTTPVGVVFRSAIFEIHDEIIWHEALTGRECPHWRAPHRHSSFPLILLILWAS